MFIVNYGKVFLIALLFFMTPSVSADIIKLNNSNRIFEGYIIGENHANYIVKLKGGGKCQVPKNWVKEIIEKEISDDKLYSDYDIYQQRLNNIDLNNADKQYDLGVWCLKKTLYQLAEEHLKKAKEINPALGKKIDKKLKYIDNINAEIIFAYAQGDMKYNQYLETENTILKLLSRYPDTDYTSQAEDILIIIWGQERAMEILNKKNNLPEVATFSSQMRGTLEHLESSELKEAYLQKCFDKARMFEERAEEVAENQRQSYYAQAQRCYAMLTEVATGYIKNYSASRVDKLANKTIISYVAPRSSGEVSDICWNMEKISDQKKIVDACNYYLKLGHKYYLQAKKKRGKERQESANIGYYCYSIVYYFTTSSDLKEEAANRMQECKILSR